MELSEESVKNMFQREEERLKDLFHINKYEMVDAKINKCCVYSK